MNEQEFIKLSQEERYNYLRKVSDEETKVNLLKYIDDQNQRYGIAYHLTKDDLKLEAIKLLTNSNQQHVIAGKIIDQKLIIKSLDYINNENIKYAIIDKYIINEIDKLLLINTINNEEYKIKIVEQFKNEALIVEALSSFITDEKKSKVIKLIKDENKKCELLNNINSKYYKIEVIKTLSEPLKIKIIEKSTNDDIKKGIINSINNEETKINLLKYINNEDIRYEITHNIKNENLLLKSLEYFEQDIYKVLIVNKLTNIELIDKGLQHIEYGSDKEIIITKIANHNDRIRLLRHISNYKLIEQLLKEATNDDIKIEYLLNLLKNNQFNDDLYNIYIGTISSFNKKIELARKTIEYGKETQKEYFRSFMLSTIFKDSKRVKTQEEVNDKINEFKKLYNDKEFTKYFDSYTLASLFETFENDEIIIQELNKLETDPVVNNLINKNIILEIVKKIADKRLKIQTLKKYFEQGKYKITIQEIEKIITNMPKETEALYDVDLMSFIYNNPNRQQPIVSFISNKKYYGYIIDVFKEDEQKYINNNKLDELLDKYKKIGPIDSKVLKTIHDIVSKYIKNITLDQVMNRIANNPSAREIIEDITINSRANRARGVIYTEEYSNKKILDKFDAIFQRTRFESLPDLATFNKMDIELCKKFNVKVWNQLISNPLFYQNNNSKRALIEIIAITGLFENDEKAELRKREVMNLFSNYDAQFTLSDVFEIMNFPTNGKEQEFFDRIKITQYELRDGIEIPEQFSGWLTKKITEKEFERIKKETGNIGSELTKFISPYVKTENSWKLRNGINIENFGNELKEEMTEEEYNNLLYSDNTPKEILNFINPFEKTNITGFKLKKNLSKDKYNEIMDIILNSNTNKTYTSENIHRIFDGLELKYDEEFFNFFLEYQDEILSNIRSQSQFKEIQKKFTIIKQYYAVRGNHSPSYKDMLLYLEKIPYDIEFGNEEFARDVKVNKVSEEGYKFYENLLQETKKRKLTTVPRHKKIYEYIKEDGKKYQVMAQVLRADDPLNLLVGESNFTNCCQRYKLTGESCMVHAATSQNGGIFATYLLEDGVPTMLTQSWLWTNETKACLDNIEATSLITGASASNKKLLQDIATFAIKQSCEEIIKSSHQGMELYLKEKTNKIKNSNLTEQEKQEELKKLETICQRQTINIITVGEGCDDLRVKESFPEIENTSSSYGPKGYVGYRDSTGEEGHKQHIIAKTDDIKLPMDPEYKDIPIYRDERRINVETGENIRYNTLRKITDIETMAHKKEMKQYTKEDGSYVILEPKDLASLYRCYLDELKIIHGEDWYYVYSNSTNEIEVFDLAKNTPRLDDEGFQQTIEISKAFEKILNDSIVLDENEEIKTIKPIKADLREDTSYLLYLTQIKRGTIEQVGDDISYSYVDKSAEKTKITQKEQDEILTNSKKIKETQNPNIIMHAVTFKPTQKQIEKLLLKQKEETNKKRGR